MLINISQHCLNLATCRPNVGRCFSKPINFWQVASSLFLPDVFIFLCCEEFIMKNLLFATFWNHKFNPWYLMETRTAINQTVHLTCVFVKGVCFKCRLSKLLFYFFVLAIALFAFSLRVGITGSQSAKPCKVDFSSHDCVMYCGKAKTKNFEPGVQFCVALLAYTIASNSIRSGTCAISIHERGFLRVHLWISYLSKVNRLLSTLLQVISTEANSFKLRSTRISSSLQKILNISRFILNRQTCN